MRQLRGNGPTWVPVLVLGSLANLLDTINTYWRASTGTLVQSVLLNVVVAGLGLWLGPKVLTRYGRLRGGRGLLEQLRLAYAWSFAPIVFGGLCWVPLWIFRGPGYEIGGDVSTLGFDLIYLGIQSTFLWYTVILVVLIAEAHRFSTWRALETSVVMFLVVVIVLYVFMFATGLNLAPAPSGGS